MIPPVKPGNPLDRFAIGLSALCAVHCVATVVLLGALSSFGYFFASPIIHEAGLAIAIVIGAVALGAGLRRHRFVWPSVFGFVGLGLMALALTLDHGAGEAAVTIAGVGLVALAHLLNMRADCACGEEFCR